MKKIRYTFVVLFLLATFMVVPNLWASHSGDEEWDLEHNSNPELPSCSSLPTFKHFTVTNSSYAYDAITLTLTPKSNTDFVLHIQLGSNAVFGAYCTGKASVCKAIGNGQDCPSGSDYSGANAWCYKAN